MKRYCTEEIYPKNQTGKCMVYFNMSHHYRRIYSAKPRIDTNLTKKQQTPFCCSSPDVYNFVRRNCMRQAILQTPRHKSCVKEEEPQKTFKQKIADSKAESKLRSLPVYHPPQKIVLPKSNQLESKCENVNVQGKDNTKESDKKENTLTKNSNNNDDSQEQIETQPQVPKQNEYIKEEESRYRPLNQSAVMFLKDITDDILRKGIYTNKSLEKLFIHHISKNKYSLPKDLMESEVARLKKELEMPVEEERSISESSSVEDEEVLTALDSLLLPASIRDQVAFSLGLKLKPPPLPSPKDSFTGSLVLTSMSDVQEKKSNKKVDDTYTMDQQEAAKGGTGRDEESVKMTSQSDDDRTVAEDYSEELLQSEKSDNVISEKSDVMSEKSDNVISEQKSDNTEAKTGERGDSSGEIVDGEKRDSEEGQSEGSVKENEEHSSDMSSIHTESS